MTPRFSAQWPDGTQSWVAWFAWMVVGFMWSAFAMRVVFFVAIALEVATDFLPDALYETVDLLISLAVAGGVAAAMLFGVRFGSKRLRMPLDACWAFASVPALMVIAGFLRPWPVFGVVWAVCALLGIVAGWREQRQGSPEVSAPRNA